MADTVPTDAGDRDEGSRWNRALDGLAVCARQEVESGQRWPSGNSGSM